MKGNGFPLVKVTCEICGGTGTATADVLFMGPFRHADPRVCERILREKRKELTKMAEKLKKI